MRVFQVLKLFIILITEHILNIGSYKDLKPNTECITKCGLVVPFSPNKQQVPSSHTSDAQIRKERRQ